MIFETERLLIRKLTIEDLEAFHQLESNPNVLKYATGEVKTHEENKIELKELITKYNIPLNNFWIYAVVKKSNSQFVGTVALVKDKEEDEIGYRFLEKYWGNSFGSEICSGLVSYCKRIGLKKIIGYVVDENVASIRILEKNNFNIVKKFISEDIKLPETKYELYL